MDVDLTPWAPLLLPLAVCRATQMILHDRILDRPRSFVMRHVNPEGRTPPDPDLGYVGWLLQCPWCVSIWVAAAAVAAVLADATRQAALAVAAVLALSLLAVGIDRAFDRWFPDEPSAPPRPPGAVMAALNKSTGDEHDGTT